MTYFHKMKYILISTLLLLFLMSGKSFAQQSYLPETLPKKFQNPDVKAALEKWANSKIGYSHPLIFIPSWQTINGVNWLSIYFKMNFIFKQNVNGDSLTQKLLENINQALLAYNSAGFEINVFFIPYVRIEQETGDGQTRVIQEFGTENIAGLDKKSVNPDRRYINPIKFYIYNPEDPMWAKQGLINNNDYFDRAFSEPISNSGVLSTNKLRSITHELTHLLLRNDDAYYDKYSENNLLSQSDSRLLSFLNASSCDPKTIHPIEVFVGLKKAGYEPQAFSKYLNSLDNLATNPKKNFLAIDRLSKEFVSESHVYLAINNQEKNVRYEISEHYYGGLEHCSKIDDSKVATYEISNFKNKFYSRECVFHDIFDLGFLDPGTYTVDVTIGESRSFSANPWLFARERYSKLTIEIE